MISEVKNTPVSPYLIDLAILIAMDCVAYLYVWHDYITCSVHSLCLGNDPISMTANPHDVRYSDEVKIRQITEDGTGFD